MNDLFTLAERQYGVITRAQARKRGLTERQIDGRTGSGAFEVIHPGVYRIPGSFPSSRQRAMAALLWCGSDALLARKTASGVLQLPIVAANRTQLLVPRTLRRKHPDLELHRTDSILSERDRCIVDGLACTTPTRTIIDLAGELDGEALEHVFDAARRMGLLTATVFRDRCAPLLTRGRPGAARLRELLRTIDHRPKDSRLEVRVARLLRQARIVVDATQHRVGPYRIDFVRLPGKRGLECDGFDWHGSRLAWKRDRRRIAWLEAQGWSIRHVTWDDATDRPDETCARIRAFFG